MDEDTLKWVPSERFKEIMAKERISPLELKEALIECLTAASGGYKEMAVLTLKKQFTDCGVSWEHPTKDGIIAVMKKLVVVSKNFRSEDVIRANYNKMMKLVNKCECGDE